MARHSDMRNVFRDIFVILILLFSFSQSVYAGPGTRDPRQLSVMIFDFDGTLANVGYYRIFRVKQNFGANHMMGFHQDVSALPEMVRVPVADFEGQTGPKIQDLLGNFSATGFIPSASQKPITLSNGEKLVPAYYYLDMNRSYEEFRPREKGSFLVDEAARMIVGKEKLLLGAYPFFARTQNPKVAERYLFSLLSMRGHDHKETYEFFQKIHGALKIPLIDSGQEAYAHLSNPAFAEFGRDKSVYVKEAYKELGQRVIHNFDTPHFLVIFENDMNHLASLEATFRSLSSASEYQYPVVPILVNLAEEDVIANPEGTSFRLSRLEQSRKMARVSVYWTNGQIERTQNLSRVFELTEGLAPDAAAKLYKANSNKFMCSRLTL